jgi:hypothetical protein
MKGKRISAWKRISFIKFLFLTLLFIIQACGDGSGGDSSESKADTIQGSAPTSVGVGSSNESGSTSLNSVQTSVGGGNDGGLGSVVSIPSNSDQPPSVISNVSNINLIGNEKPVYYVTQSGSGNTDGSSYTNAMSVAAHNKSSFSGDTIIYLCDTITSQVSPPSSGTLGHPIVYRGDYSGHPGTISGFKSLVGWTNAGNGIYTKAITGFLWLVEDGKPLKKGTWPLTEAGTWQYDSGTAYYMPTIGTPTDHTVGCSSINYCIVLSNRAFISILNLTLQYAGTCAIYTYESSAESDGITITNCNLSYNFGGILFSAKDAATWSDSSVTNCSFTNCLYGFKADCGSTDDVSTGKHVNYTISKNTFTDLVYVYGSSGTTWGQVKTAGDSECIGMQDLQNSSIYDNTMWGGYKVRGIFLYNHSSASTINNRIYRNTLTNTGGFGFSASGPAAGQEISNNLVYSNVFNNCGRNDPIYLTAVYLGNVSLPSTTFNYFYNNTISGCDLGIYDSSRSYWKIKNNIIYNWSTYAIQIIDAPSPIEIDYNDIYPSAGNPFYHNGSARSMSYWQNILGFDIHGLTLNPLLTGYALSASSPCIDAGTTLSIVTTDIDGQPRPNGSAIDIGAYEFSL